MAPTEERQFDNLLDDLVSELAMEEVGDPDEPIITAPAPTPTPAATAAAPVEQTPPPSSGRTWLAVAGILGGATATLGVAAFLIFGGMRAEAADVRTQDAAAEPTPAVAPTPAPEPQVVPVMVPQPAPVVAPDANPATETAAEEPELEAAQAPEKQKRKPRKKRRKRRRPRKKTRKAPPSGDRFEDL